MHPHRNNSVLLPAVQAAREAARRITYADHLKQIGLALHQYVVARRVLPSGCVVVPAYPGSRDYSAWIEARDGPQGTSWMLAILPYIEETRLFDRWDFHATAPANREVAGTDIPTYYCPSRRSSVRGADLARMLPGLLGGGNDYGGCLGRANGYRNECSATVGCGHSLNGWAVGGAATLFVTAKAGEGGDKGQPGGLNNGYFESAGSEHPGGVHFGLVDGSVRFLGDEVDRQIYAWLGAIRDSHVFPLPD
ncbi:MAG: DUF1559 domain-containing protein [Planctomycetia bacterium]|nr:DUF1559 domain-containing protein [Planctomycetia bacterium]